MEFLNLKRMYLLYVLLFSCIFYSCSVDNDLFLDSVLIEEVTVIDETDDSESEIDDDDSESEIDDDDSDSEIDDDDSDSEIDDDDSDSEMDDSNEDNMTSTSTCAPSKNPISVTSVEGLTNAEPGSTVQINGVINALGAKLSANLIIISGNGMITGTNINLNNACIYNSFNQIFANNVTFNERYNNSRLSFETFGANGDDSLEDDAEIETAIEQSESIIGQNGKVYIKNKETDFNSLTGLIDWDLNNSTIRTTSNARLSHGSGSDQGNRYLFQFRKMDVKIYNGEFDGRDLASRCFYLRGTNSYDFDNVNIHNYYAPPGARIRALAFLIPVESNFSSGRITNSTIANIGAASDGNVNNVPFGFSKGIYCTVGTETGGTHLYEGNVISNIYGDDAEGFSNTHTFGYSGTYRHATNGQRWIIRNNTFKGCQRRALKVNLSNVEITDNIIESPTEAPELKGNQASQLQIFSIIRGQNITNVNVRGNTIRILGTAVSPAFGINDADDCLIENNVFEASHIDILRFITFGVTGSQNGLYQGDLDNTVIFRNNTSTNLFYRLPGVYQAVNGGFVFEDNTVNMNIDRKIQDHWWGVFRIQAGSGQTEPYTFKNVNVNIHYAVNAEPFFGGAFLSLGRDLKNVTFDNFDINYTGSVEHSYPFGRITTPAGSGNGNIDNTNTIVNCTITGAIGTGAILGGPNSTVVVANSYGDNGSAITANSTNN